MQQTYRLSKSAEKELRKKLSSTILTIVSIIVGMFLLLSFFAPKLGVFFGFFSIHRNDKEEIAQIKPSTPLFSKVPEATKEDKISLNGFAQSGMTVILYANGPEVARTVAGADGIFTFNDVALIQGTNTIWAKTEDGKGNSSENSKNYSINVDKEKPKITVESPKEGETVKNLDGRIKITGKVNEKAEIKINDKVTVLKPDLSFEFLLGAQEGSLEIKIKATDTAGNEGEEKIFVKYVKGS